MILSWCTYSNKFIPRSFPTKSLYRLSRSGGCLLLNVSVGWHLGMNPNKIYRISHTTTFLPEASNQQLLNWSSDTKDLLTKHCNSCTMFMHLKIASSAKKKKCNSYCTIIIAFFFIRVTPRAPLGHKQHMTMISNVYELTLITEAHRLERVWSTRVSVPHSLTHSPSPGQTIDQLRL